jgi:hypothetical protein
MQSFKDMLLAETVDRINPSQRPGEKRFADKHVVDKKDYPAKSPEDQFKGEIRGAKKKKLRTRDYENDETAEVYEDTDQEISEEVIDDIRDIVKRKQYKDVVFSNGKKQKVDLTTASLLLQVYEKLSKDNQKKVGQMLNDKKKFAEFVAFAYQATK